MLSVILAKTAPQKLSLYEGYMQNKIVRKIMSSIICVQLKPSDETLGGHFHDVHQRLMLLNIFLVIKDIEQLLILNVIQLKILVDIHFIK